MSDFVITPKGPFSLSASVRFSDNFVPAHDRRASSESDAVRMRLAFPVEGSWQTAGLVVTQLGDGSVHVRVDGPEPEGLSQQLARILSLDVDATGLADVCQRDAVLERLAASYPGLRPVCFHSPYEAACWAIIGHRIRITQAAAIKERIAHTYGQKLFVDGIELAAFPPPQTLLNALDDITLPAVKRERLRGIAAAALDGGLDAGHLRAQQPANALDELKQLNGIGPFSTELILIRGAGAPDIFPTNERRLHDSMRQLYQEPDADLNRLAALAHSWSEPPRDVRRLIGVTTQLVAEDVGERSGRFRARLVGGHRSARRGVGG